MQSAIAFEVDIKSPAPKPCKSPAQIRLESRATEEKSPKTPVQIQNDLENAAVNRQVLVRSLLTEMDNGELGQVFLQARVEKSSKEYVKAKAISAQQMESFQELTNQKFQEIDSKLATAEANRAAQAERSIEKTKTMNLRVTEAQKKRSELDAIEKEATDKFAETTVEKQTAAEVRRSQLLEETKAKNAAEVAKAKELAAKKQQSLQEMDEKLREKISAAEERRNNLLQEQKEKAAAAVEHAKMVAATQAEKEASAREELRSEIEQKLAEAENRRLSSSPSKSARSPSTPGDRRRGIEGPVPPPPLDSALQSEDTQDPEASEAQESTGPNAGCTIL